MNKTTMAACLALLTLALALVYVEPSEVEASLSDGDIHENGTWEYRVVEAGRMYDDSDLGDWTRIWVVPGSSTVVPEGAFEGCTKVRYVYFDQGVTGIGKRAFADMEGLYNVYGGDVETIGQEAFAGSSVEVATFGKELVSIGDGAFRDCAELKNLTLGKTSVTQIGSGVFRDSGIEVLDMRNITGIASDAFTGSEISLQIVTSGQETYYDGADLLVYDGETDFFDEIKMNNGKVSVMISRIEFFDAVPCGGGETDVEYTALYGMELMGAFTHTAGTDYTLKSRNAVIDIPDDLGIEGQIVLEPGVYRCTLPDVTLGDLELLHWTVDGVDGSFKEIGYEIIVDNAGRVRATPVFGDAILTFDHSNVSGMTDTSALDTSMKYTYGSTYPDLPDVEGYAFDGWEDGGVRYAAGDRITDYTSHTAKSLWTPNQFFDLVYTDSDGTTIHTESHGLNQKVTADASIVAEEDESQRFLGWSLDGSIVLTQEDEMTMSSDIVLKPVFEDREVFTVTYMVGSDVYDTAEGYDGREFTVAVDDPVGNDIFTAWTGGGMELSKGSAFTLESDLTLTADWRSRIAVFYTFVSNGETVARENGVEGLPFTVTKDLDDTETHIFDGWAMPDGTIIQPGDEIVSATDMTLTASFHQRAQFTVSYVTESGTEEVPVLEGTTHIVAGEPVMDGMIFTGWHDGDGNVRACGEEILIQGDVTLTAEWREPETYTVTFVDPYGETRTEEKTERSDFVIGFGCEDTETHIFDHWTLDDGTAVSEGDVLTEDREMTLTATYHERRALTVTYTDGEEVLSEVDATEGRMHRIDLEVVSDDGRIFTGWTTADGDVYSNGTEVPVWDDLTLTAQWRDPHTYTVTFVDPYGETRTVEKVEGIPLVVEISCEDTETHIFDHWTLGDGTVVEVGDVITEDAETTLTASYHERATFTVSYMNGDTSLGSSEHLEGTTVTIDIADPTSDTGLFVCWEDADGTPYHRSDTLVVSGDIVLTAQWREPGEFTVTYRDGDRDLLVRTGTEGSAFTVDASDPTRTGKVFLHWTGPDGKEYDRGDRITLTSDIVLTAQWRDAEVHTVTYMDGGRTLGTSVGYEGDRFVVSQPDPVSSSRDFVHWTDGTGTYVSGDSFLLDGDVTLKAVWVDSRFNRVTFVSEGEVVMTVDVKEGSSHTIGIDLGTVGEGFLGWAKTQDGEPVYGLGSTFTPASDMSLYAVWEEKAEPGTDADPEDPGDDADPNDGTSPSGGQNGGSGGIDRTLVGAAIAVTAAVAAVMIVVIRRA